MATWLGWVASTVHGRCPDPFGTLRGLGSFQDLRLLDHQKWRVFLMVNHQKHGELPMKIWVISMEGNQKKMKHPAI